MKKLLSLPPNVVNSFHDVTRLSHDEYFCTSDPVGHKLGSGGGTAWLLEAARRDDAPEAPFKEWLAKEKRVLLHAGGQSRRLPAYASSGKVLTPVPVFRWARGQKIDQTLLDLQMPLYERILEKAPAALSTLIASGDVYLRATEPLQDIPDADVVCYGLWADVEQASHHGVFMMSRENPDVLDFVLQKPSPEEQARLMQTHYAMMDIGVWLLSDRAVHLLMRKCGETADGLLAQKGVEGINYYDLYTDFGGALGLHPTFDDPELADLKVAVLPLPGGEFYHFGTSPELLSSSLEIQNLVKDQRFIIQKGVKKQPSVFTQNAVIAQRPGACNSFVWIENSFIPETWQYGKHHIFTGIPENNWQLSVPDGVCIDIEPVGAVDFVLRPYGYTDAFRGRLDVPETLYLGQPVTSWLAKRGISMADLGNAADLQAAPLFPATASLPDMERLLQWFIADTPEAAVTALWRSLPRYSADDISAKANLHRLFAQREQFQNDNLPALAQNWRRSVFYQVNLKDAAHKFADAALPLPEALPQDAPLMTRIHDAMFRSEALRLAGKEGEAAAGDEAFRLLREGLTANALRHKSHPVHTTYSDQIVWARSSVRIDVAGGWTDTPPYSLVSGGNVVNLAIELNGQPPLQVYVKPSAEPVIICRSIDLGAMERIETFEELKQYNKVGSPFSIPKAALTLAGFLPGFCDTPYRTLREQLEDFGCGIEITLLAAIPAGSGLGTSSILAATVLGAVSDFCGLHWDKNEICNRTLVLEQLLTTGGGWQDQYGGVLPGIKLLQTNPGFDQNATARWLPSSLFTAPETAPCHLLYYTGITRTAKNILAEIVRGMFLNNTEHLALLDDMKQHALEMFRAIQQGDLETYGRLLAATWEQNKRLDAGTNPPVVEALCRKVHDYCLGYKLPGAGGGGFLYMVAKDIEAARRIRALLSESPIMPAARFVEMSISDKGLQVSRS